MSLSVNDLNRYMEIKRRDKYATFEKIHEQCQKQILKYANHDKYRCFFTVPEFILGLPRYNLNAAILYVIEKLKSKGFLIKYYHPNILYVSWDTQEIKGKRDPFKMPAPLLLGHTGPTLRPIAYTPNVPPRILPSDKNPLFPPMPEQTRVVSKPDQGIVMPHMPSYDLPMPQSTHVGTSGNQKNSNFIKSISTYKPSGKFVLDV